MTRTLAVLATAAALGAATMAAPAQAHWHGGIGPGLAFGLAAGAITAGALAATSPYYNQPLLLRTGLLLRAGAGLSLWRGALRLLWRALLLQAPLLVRERKPGSDASGLSIFVQ